MHRTSLSLWPIFSPLNYSELQMILKNKKKYESIFNHKTIYFICSKSPARFNSINPTHEKNIFSASFNTLEVNGSLDILIDNHFGGSEKIIQDGNLHFLVSETEYLQMKLEDLSVRTIQPERTGFSVHKADSTLNEVMSFKLHYIGIAKNGIIERFKDGHRGLGYAAKDRHQNNEIYILPFYIVQNSSLITNLDIPIISSSNETAIDNHVRKSLVSSDWNEEERFLWSVEQALISNFGKEYIDDDTAYNFPTPKNLVATDSITDLEIILKSKFISMATPKLKIVSGEHLMIKVSQGY